jgi:dTDP-4-dehydrorhamnose 3,5-epimerase
MRFTALDLPGSYLIEPELMTDERGHFARMFCTEEFAAQGLETNFVQRSISFNHQRGTLRGLHFQKSPHGETKIVRCTAGAIFDVLVDLRPGSPTYGKSVSRELSAANRAMLYIPEGFAHGFLTLSDNTEVYYEISRAYVPEAASGIAFDDPDLAIRWPLAPTVISDKDRALPRLADIALSRDLGFRLP